MGNDIPSLSFDQNNNPVVGFIDYSAIGVINPNPLAMSFNGSNWSILGQQDFNCIHSSRGFMDVKGNNAYFFYSEGIGGAGFIRKLSCNTPAINIISDTNNANSCTPVTFTAFSFWKFPMEIK